MASVVETVIRGNVVTFSVGFTDFQGVPVLPTNVVLHIQYLDDTTKVLVVLQMNNVGDVYTCNWDTNGVSAPTTVNWSIRATAPDAADDGTFELTANWANPLNPP